MAFFGRFFVHFILFCNPPLCVVLKIRFCSLKKTFASERSKREREEGQRDEERRPIEKSFCYILLFIYRVFRQGETRIYY